MTEFLAWLDSLPLIVVMIAFWCGAMIRSNSTYWIGRLARFGVGKAVDRHRAARERTPVGSGVIDARDPGVGLPEAPEHAPVEEDDPARLTRKELARRLVDRLGPIAVSVGFLTVGLQTAIMLTSGAIRMPLSRFIPATMIGAVAWSLVYSTVGMGVIGAFWAAILGNPLTAVALVLVVALIIVGAVFLDRRVLAWAHRKVGSTPADPA
ncbi:DedA family protein [Parenemella sanctibonifatiensis]|uniref:Uncharacterized protein n=1 Tax=Parenemella sanctibonifatiensis TaxID=2016505 RepID=A0A255ENB4_9ACTN|nr:VTT domain-containing protein [Parenemella sanctibonifatiensis]OYN92710.1 hypothetical protein CGZ91_04375 [Parenemella sanctibonifatiensis]